MNETTRYWADWAIAAGVRAVKTIAQTAVGVIGTAAVIGEVDWIMVAGAAGLAGVVSLLTSVAGLPEVEYKELLQEEEEKNGGTNV